MEEDRRSRRVVGRLHSRRRQALLQSNCLPETRRAGRRSRPTALENAMEHGAAEGGMKTAVAGRAPSVRVEDAPGPDCPYPAPVGRLATAANRILRSIQAQTVPITNQKYQLNDR